MKHSVFFFLAVLLAFPPVSLSACQQEAKPKEKKRSVTEQAAIDEFDSAVECFNELVDELGDPAKQNEMRFYLARIFQRVNKEEAIRLLEKVDRGLLDLQKREVDYVELKLELHGADDYLKSVDARASEEDKQDHRDAVYCDAVSVCPIDKAQPFLDKIVSDLRLSFAYSDLAFRANKKGDARRAKEFTEKWFFHATEAYKNSDGGNIGQLKLVIANLVAQNEIERAQVLCQRLFEFADEENAVRALFATADVAGRSGMPELVAKVKKRIDELGGEDPNRIHPIEFDFALAHARQGNYEQAIEYVEKCDDPEIDGRVLESIVLALVKDGKTKQAMSYTKEFSVDNRIDMLLDIARVADKMEQRESVQVALAETRRLANENADNTEISVNERTRCGYFEKIARAHFRHGEGDQCGEWVQTITNERFRVHIGLAEVSWRANQIVK